jgi:hypothetical protein
MSYLEDHTLEDRTMSKRFESKFLIVLIAISTAALMVSSTAAAKDGKVSVTLSSESYEIISSPQGHAVKMEEFGRLLVPGKPNLPAKIFAVAIPPGAEVTQVTFETGEGIVLSGEYRIQPTPLPRMSNDEDPAFLEHDKKIYEANYNEVYGSDEPYPSQPGEFIRKAGYRKYNLVDIRVSPFAWYPQSGKLVLHPTVRVHVDYKIPEGFSSDAVMHDRLPRTEKIAREVILNYDQAQSWYPGGRSSGGRGFHDFVIITLSHLTLAVQPLIDWETAKGRTVEVVTTDWIESIYTGYDLAEKIRNFLRDKYPAAEWGIEDVCLVGHVKDLPIRRCAQNVGSGDVETDYYYAELSLPDSDSWDLDGDHQWGENEDPIDFYNEVNMGRIPWSDAAVVEHICKKSVTFEQNNDPAFKKNMLLMGAFWYPTEDSATVLECRVDPVVHPWMSDWTLTRMYEKNINNYSVYPCDAELLHQNVLSVWPQGKYAVVNWAGHGSAWGSRILGLGAPFFITYLDYPFFNDNYPSIILANSCRNSDTDYDNIGMKMLKQGAVGFMGNNGTGFYVWGWDDPSDGNGPSFGYYFNTCVTSSDYTQGEALQWSLCKMYTDGLWLSEVKYQIFSWSSLMGNPDLGLAPTSPLSFSYPEDLPGEYQPPGTETRITLNIHPGHENYVPGTGLLHYRFDPNDPYSTTSLTPLGDDLYEALLPCAMPGDACEFYFSAQGDGGSTVCSPTNAPAEVYFFDVCIAEMLMEDDFEEDLGWTVENSNLMDGAWERAVPAGNGERGEPVMDSDGSGACFVTDNEAGNSDVDGGPTRLVSPALDLSNSSGVFEISYHRWHYNDDNDDTFTVEISNDNGSTWTMVEQVQHTEGWNEFTFRVSDFVLPTSQVRMRFSAMDNPNNSVTEAGLDAFKVQRLYYEPTLWAGTYSIPSATGAVVDYSLNAGAAHGNRTYLILGSLSGTYPGTTLPGGAHLPLNWDTFTNLVLDALGTSIFPNFYGNLDASGEAEAFMNVLGPVDPALVGLKMYFAYALNNPWDFASNPVAIEILP